MSVSRLKFLMIICKYSNSKLDWLVDGWAINNSFILCNKCKNCLHNSFTDFIDGQYSNVILDLHPEKGNRFIMQTSPCWVWSGSDFFVNSKGIIGTETTMGGFIAYENNIPVGYRIRQAMQY